MGSVSSCRRRAGRVATEVISCVTHSGERAGRVVGARAGDAVAVGQSSVRRTLLAEDHETEATTASEAGCSVAPDPERSPAASRERANRGPDRLPDAGDTEPLAGGVDDAP